MAAALLWKSLIFSFRKDDLTSYKTSEWDIITIVSFCWLSLLQSQLYTWGRGLGISNPATSFCRCQCPALCVCLFSISPGIGDALWGQGLASPWPLFPAWVPSPGSPSSEEPRTWGRKSLSCQAFCTGWCLAPHEGAISACLWMGGERPVDLAGWYRVSFSSFWERRVGFDQTSKY